MERVPLLKKEEEKEDTKEEELSRKGPKTWKCGFCQYINDEKYQGCYKCYSLNPSETTKLIDLLLKWENPGTFSVVVAVDFGTDGTGLAFAVKGSETVYYCDDWSLSDADKHKSGNLVAKTKTVVLVKNDNDYLAFGNAALFKFASSGKEEGREHWNLFKNFKMNLYEGTGIPGRGIADIAETLEAYGPYDAPTKVASAESVVVAALKFIKDKALNFLESKKVEVKGMKDIQWVLTVPAIWSETSKGKMQQWAAKAGMTDPDIHNHVIIAYEPECASFSIITEINSTLEQASPGAEETKTDIGPLMTGDRFMVVDMGGGTVDIVCHELVEKYKVQELIAPSGGPWGSIYIDKGFEHFLYQLFGEMPMRSYRASHPGGFVTFLQNFEKAKKTFFSNERKPKFHNVAVPEGFDDFMLETCKKEVKSEDKKALIAHLGSKIKKYPWEESGSLLYEQFKYDGEYLKLSQKVWEGLFDAQMTPIFEHIEKLLKRVVFKEKPLKCMFLVGGFAESKYVQTQFETHFQRHRFQLVIPKNPAMRVVDGAVRLVTFVLKRVMPETYGIETCLTKKKAERHDKIKDYVEKYKFYSDVQNETFVSQCFLPFVKSGESVPFNHTIEHELMTARLNQTSVSIAIYESKVEDPGIVDNLEKIGTVKFSLPANYDHKTEQFIARFYFGDTTIKVTASLRGKEQEDIVTIDFTKK